MNIRMDHPDSIGSDTDGKHGWIRVIFEDGGSDVEIFLHAEEAIALTDSLIESLTTMNYEEPDPGIPERTEKGRRIVKRLRGWVVLPGSRSFWS